MRKSILALGMMLAGAGAAFGFNGWGLYGAHWDTDDADNASGVGAKISMEMIEGVQLELRATHLSDLSVEGDGAQAELEVLPLEAGLALELPANDDVAFLLGGGLGYYLIDGDIAVPSAGLAASSDDEIGYYLTAGAEWRVRRSGHNTGATSAALFAEIIYRMVEAEKMAFDASSSSLRDADLDGLGVNVGLMIEW